LEAAINELTKQVEQLLKMVHTHLEQILLTIKKSLERFSRGLEE